MQVNEYILPGFWYQDCFWKLGRHCYKVFHHTVYIRSFVFYELIINEQKLYIDIMHWGKLKGQ